MGNIIHFINCSQQHQQSQNTSIPATLHAVQLEVHFIECFNHQHIVLGIWGEWVAAAPCNDTCGKLKIPRMHFP